MRGRTIMIIRTIGRGRALMKIIHNTITKKQIQTGGGTRGNKDTWWGGGEYK